MNEIKHYGTPRHSGRYPWGSGKNPYQRHKNFMAYYHDLRKEGMSESDIAKGLGMSANELRDRRSIATTEIRKADAAMALKLKDKGYSNTEIGRRMGKPESTIRSLLNPVLAERSHIITQTADMLKSVVDEKDFVDIGKGTERYLGVTRNRLTSATTLLKDEGYNQYKVYVKQAGTNNYTSMIVLAKPDISKAHVLNNMDQIGFIDKITPNKGRSWLGLEPVQSIDSKRILIRYAEDGGANKDGVIELRRGVDDISLGNMKYAQVRIGVDDTHFMKGMAIYGDIPKGYDVVYNTNKHKGVPADRVFKEMKRKEDGSVDADNPFGASIKQGGQKGALNIIYEEGDWQQWNRTLSSQMLSKQPIALAKRQLQLDYSIRNEEFESIKNLTNPTVKQVLLKAFADECDSAAVHLAAASMPRQSTSVILPAPHMKETEIYAPNYRNGEKVVLIRHPHGGIFEIPQLTVNNKDLKIRDLIGNARDAVAINPKVAERLSGADFDGDTVLVIPNNKNMVKVGAPLEGLSGFDPIEKYPPYDGLRTIDGGVYNGKTGKVEYVGKPKKQAMQNAMGNISNLITDMTIKGAKDAELARAVKHSMVVIDSEKHHLDYKRSYDENQIAQLKRDYQGGANRGASTLISRASAEIRVPERKLQYRPDPETGERVYYETGASYVNRQGKTIYKQTKTTRMDVAKDARELSSGTFIEEVYVNYANKMKAMGNEARKEALGTPNLKQAPSAKKVYADEVASLENKLHIALMNAPKERQAQLLMNKIVEMKKADNPGMTPEEEKKVRGMAIVEARHRIGSKKESVVIEPKEWEAIQAGAVSHSKLLEILNNSNIDQVKQLATPKDQPAITPARLARIKSMLAAGHTQAEVADMFGVSTSTIMNAVNE